MADDDKFGVWVSRVISRDYKAYREILRIQPGYAQYDWLVTQYYEREINEKSQNEENGTNNSSLTKTGSDIITDDGSNVRSGDRIESYSGSDVNTTDFGSKTTRSGSAESEDSYDNYKEHTNTDGHTKYGKSTTETPRVSSVQSTEYKDVEGSQDTVKTEDRSLSKSAPQSLSYSGAANGEIPSLNWQYPSAQNQGDKKDTTNYGKHNISTVTNQAPVGTNMTQLGGQDNTGEEKTLDITGTKTNTTTYHELADAKTGSDTETLNYGKSVTTTYKDLKDKTDNTHTYKHDTTDTTQGTSGKTTMAASNNTMQTSGRQGDTGTLLQKASDFITYSNAWAWLSQRLEVCFQGVYDI